jgi:hypothetical protein
MGQQILAAEAAEVDMLINLEQTIMVKVVLVEAELL